MADPKKIANNILDFLIDPTRIPVQQRVYFRPEENLQNQTYEGAKADAVKAYKDQKHNSDFYPNRNRQITREATLMDRKSLIASFDILSRNFKEDDLIAKDLRTMAAAVSKMSDDEFSKRQASDAPDFEEMHVEAAKTFKCPKCGTKVLEQTGYCVKCKKKVKKAGDDEDKEETPAKDVPKDEPSKEEAPKKDDGGGEGDDVEASVQDFWTKEAMTRVAKGLVSDVLGMTDDDEEDKEDEDKKEEEAKTAKKEEEKKEPPKEEDVSAKKVPKEEEVSAKKEEKKEPPKEEEVSAKKEEVVEANKKAALPVEEKKPEVPEKEEVKSTVNTDILASITFGDISLDAPIIEAGNMTEEEKAKLAGLFN